MPGNFFAQLAWNLGTNLLQEYLERQIQNVSQNQTHPVYRNTTPHGRTMTYTYIYNSGNDTEDEDHTYSDSETPEPPLVPDTIDELQDTREGWMRLIRGVIGSAMMNGDPSFFESVKVTLTEEQFRDIPEIEYKKEDDKEDQKCSICFDEFEIGTKIKKLGCNHLYHVDCIKDWLLKSSTTCPVCRKDTRPQNQEEN